MTAHASRWTASPEETLRVGDGFRLADVDTRSTPGYGGDKRTAEADLPAHLAELDELQERLFADSRVRDNAPSILLVLQAMDTAGKGGIVRHVMGAVDPQGVQLTAFKKPTAEELAHDFLWRIEQRTPQPGMIGVFDRSHYEDVLIGRVRELASPEEIERRYGAIIDFERGLIDRGVHVIKVMLHISPDEQKARLQERLDRPDKHWKFNPGDIDEREMWPAYMDAYQAVFDRTSIPEAPWHVVPADRKWFARLAVSALLHAELRRIDPQWPVADFDVEQQKRRLAAS